ncbi:hypothetical protein ACVW00_004204 [Marmoricola sp. URHA0025 HA25]
MPAMDPRDEAAYAGRVRAWAGQLRTGSSPTWREFLARPDPEKSLRHDGPLPGAAQLELVRRLADQHPAVPRFAELADLVLTTAGPGRGLVDAPLPWPAERTVGTPAVEPDELPAEEILRACAGVLARLLAPEAALPSPRVARPWRPWRKGFTLLGGPTTVELVRGALHQRGLREGGARTTWFVLGGPLEDLMAQRWSARVRAGAGVRWQRLWRTAATNDRLPPAIALPTIARHVAEEFDPARVHVVLAEDPQGALEIVADVLGVAGGPVEAYADVLATDLLRRVNPPLGLAVGEEARRRIIDRVWRDLAGGEEAAPLGAPAAQLDWAVATGERMANALSAGRYAVHGDPAIVVPTRRPGVRRVPDPDAVLAHALLVVGRAWQRSTERGVQP